MTPDSYYHRLIAGGQRGVVASALRGGLTLLSWPYAAVIGLRNAYYDHASGGVRRAAVPVISVGNLTTGGTGKTPMAIWIAERLLSAGRRPAVLMRGYKGGGGGCCQANRALQVAIHGDENDEAREIRRRCPRVDLVIDPDRVAGAQRAAAMGSDVVVMDDGFQHRRLGRDLDIVLVDATEPFGGGMLPRGMLREPAASLGRADLIVVTRVDQVPEAALADLQRQLTQLGGGAPVLAACHRPVELCDAQGRGDPDMPVESAGGRTAWVFAGLGNPAAFTATVTDLGVSIAGRQFWPDHHTWSDAELDEMARQVRDARPDFVLTTEKDAVKLPPDRPNWPAPLRVLRIGIEFYGDGAETAGAMIDRVIKRSDDADG